MTAETEQTGSLARIDGDRAVSSQIIHTLTEYFFSGEFHVGSKLPSERQLASELGVSRAAVREAVQSLGLLGVVDIRQGDGTYLSAGSDILPRVIEWGLFLGEPRVLDLVEARQQLEYSLVGFTARRRTDADMELLRSLVAGMDAAADNVDEFVELDIEFHAAIATYSRNSALAGMLTGITSLLRVWMRRSLKIAGETTGSNDEHRAILEAIAAKDPRAAQSAMRKHLRSAERRLRSSLKTHPEHLH